MSRSYGIIALAGLAAVSLASAAGPERPVLRTPAEESGYTRYSQSEDIALFLSRAASLAPQVKVRVIGRTRDTREYGSRDLYLCILSEKGIGRPEEKDPAKLTVLITASQHGREQSAKEAALALIRDIALGGMKPLLEAADILVIPQANPYGNFFDRRENEQGLDLNRDHIKLESESAAAIHRVFSEWLPEVTIDVHEKGDDYYRVSIGCVSNINIALPIQEFSRSVVLAEVERDLGRLGIPFHEYLVKEEMGINTASGAALREEDLKGREMMTRYSTTDLNDGRNSLGIYQTMSFIQEGASRHDLPTLAERTRWQHAGLRSFLEAVVRNAPAVRSVVLQARQDLREAYDRGGAGDPVHLKMEFARDDRQPELVLKKFESADSPILGVLKTDKKAGEPVADGDLKDYPWPRRLKVVTETVKNWFPRVAPRLSVTRPRGYIISAARMNVVETLLRHGLEVRAFTADMSLEVELYRVAGVVPAAYDYLPPESLAVERTVTATIVKKGDFYVSCGQPGGKAIVCFLEPQSDFGFIRYRALGLVPEAGGLYAIWRHVGPERLPLMPYKGFIH